MEQIAVLFDGESANVAGRDVVESKATIVGEEPVDHTENAEK